jgi:hypothetical protein
MSGAVAAAAPVHVPTAHMPAHSHSIAPCLDGNALNLCLYFNEVEALSSDASLNDEGKICHALQYASQEDNKLWAILPEALLDNYTTF